jgi:hypothetical protein
VSGSATPTAPIAPPSRDTADRRIAAMAAVLAHVTGVPVADARSRIESVLARGDRVLEVVDGRS